jgi:hypothetical protein
MTTATRFAHDGEDVRGTFKSKVRGSRPATSRVMTPAPIAMVGSIPATARTIDPDGYMHITGSQQRRHQVRAVIWISSIALENAAMSHPAVRAGCGGFAIRHEKWVERPLLVVAAAPGKALTGGRFVILPRDEGHEVVAARRDRIRGRVAGRADGQGD